MLGREEKHFCWLNVSTKRAGKVTRLSALSTLWRQVSKYFQTTENVSMRGSNQIQIINFREIRYESQATWDSTFRYPIFRHLEGQHGSREKHKDENKISSILRKILKNHAEMNIYKVCQFRGFTFQKTKNKNMVTVSTFNCDATFLKIAKYSETQNEAYSYKNSLKLIKASEHTTLFWVQETFIEFWSLKFLLVKSKQPCSRRLETGLPVFWSHTDGPVVNVNHHVTFMWYH
jgi:hypothetical protein